MNVSSRYWSSIDENECVFCVNEQQKVYYKVRQVLQSAIEVITKCDDYYKLRQYKREQCFYGACGLWKIKRNKLYLKKFRYQIDCTKKERELHVINTFSIYNTSE